MSAEPTRARPSFAQAFPSDPALDALVEAFARGDYRLVRSAAPELERSSSDAAVRAAAHTLLERTSADPLATWLVVLAAALLVVLGGYWIVEGKAPPAPTAPPPQARPVEHVR
ncbi:MAG TPA: hypothetical protein VKU41_09915 [Polyangiaceae bacterium]|nr:hypothetical protein [Polyangiaceae bacterium]